MSTRPRAVIFGLSGPTLLNEERDFFKRVQPLGFILFERNIKSPDQVRTLIHQLKATVDHSDVPILIDQEGGRVSRLKPPHWRNAPAATVFGIIAEDDPKTAAQCARDNAWLMGRELQDLGVTVNCAPCCDLHHISAHPVIGDRAFAHAPEVVATLAMQTMHGLLEAGITPVIKHLPGHGRANADTHESFAIVRTSRQELMDTDFRAFRLALDYMNLMLPHFNPWGMTAHVTYADIDSDNAATQSSTIVDGVIRGSIGFKGFLVSDCITMKALGGSLSQRAQRSLDAGCDAVLHCSGNLTEMIEVTAGVRSIRSESEKRWLSSQITTPQRDDDANAVARALDNTLRQARVDFDVAN